MSLKITSIVKENGPACEHVTVTGDHEGVTRSFKTSLGELDALLASYETDLDAMKDLVMLWAAYRRRYGRNLVNVVIA